MASYTPPSGDAVNFTFTGGYTAPEGDKVNLLFGVVASIEASTPARSTFYSDTGFDRTKVEWTSSVGGAYRVEMGGTGANTGALIASGACAANVKMMTTITYAQMAAAAGFTGPGEYRFNIYVKSSDNIWTPFG